MARQYINNQPPVVHGMKFNAASASDTLREGHILAADISQTTDADDARYVTQVNANNIMRELFVVHAQSDGATDGDRLTLVPMSSRTISNLNVRTNQSLTAGDYLGPQVGSYFAGRGALQGPAIARVLDTTDGSSTATVARCDAGFTIASDSRALSAFQAEYFNDFFHVDDGAADAAEWLSTIATGGAVAAADDGAGGFLSMATDTTDNDVISVQKNGEAFKLDKPLFFEVKNVSVSHADGTDWFIGLSTPTTGFLDSNTNDFIGFWVTAGDSSQTIVFACDKDGAGESTSASTVDVTDSTNFDLAFYFDGTTVTPYVNGTALTAVTTTIPDDEALSPVFEMRNAAAAASTVLVDSLLIRNVR